MRWPAFATAALMALFAPGAMSAISPGAYVDGLAAIRTNLASGRPAEAASLARALASERISSNPPVLADRSLLDSIASNESRDLAVSLRRLDATIAAWRAALPSGAAKSDRALIEQLRKQAQSRAVQKGGAAVKIPTSRRSAIELIAEWLAGAWDAISRVAVAIFDFLLSLWPSPRTADGDSGPVDRAVIAVVALVTGLLILLLLQVRKRTRASAATQTSTPRSVPVSATDDDPLSRETFEWTEHAASLAEAGRFREAIRAWYHAVLAGLYRAGQLQYRKGRTNWEYVAGISSQTSWRPDFVTLTRTFEREWYGHSESTAEVSDACRRAASGILSHLSPGRTR